MIKINKMDNFKECDICKLEANNICLECMLYLCDSCFKFIHEKAANKQHKKEIIDSFIPLNIKCELHPKKLNDFFCIEEKGKKIYKL